MLGFDAGSELLLPLITLPEEKPSIRGKERLNDEEKGLFLIIKKKNLLF